MDQPQRLTAHKIWISDLLQGEYSNGQGEFDPGAVRVHNIAISRVNIVASVVEKTVKEDGSYATTVIDDSSGYLHLKAWKETTKIFEHVNIGDLILVVGKVREYNGSIYVTPEVIKKLETSQWAKLRRLELTRLYGEPRILAQETQRITEEPAPNAVLVEENVHDEPVNKRQTIITLIETLSTSEGADRNQVAQNSRLTDAEAVIQDLIKEGEIFEISPGKLRVL